MLSNNQLGETMKPLDLNDEDFKKTINAFHSESDRAAAVLAGGFIESFLAKFLLSFMVADETVKDLFDGFGPFADYNQRYETAYAFGLIDSAQRRDGGFNREVHNSTRIGKEISCL